MKFNRTHTLKEIAEIIEVKFIGDESFPIEGLNEIHRVDKGEIVFVDHPKYYKKAIESKATVILINKEIDCPEGKALLISDNPFRDFIKLGQHFSLFTNSIKPISDSSIIGEKTIIQPNVFIGNYVTIGKNCIIHANASIFDHTSIGDNVIIGSGTVIGGDAFYYKKTENGYEKLKSVGKVIIEDEVEIGTNCTIDRGVTSATIIKKGSKLDNLIQIGHDTIIGERCLIASQSCIAGCCTIEN
ncbi:MAG: LpxD N-terminal domain-containing protein [Solirubrobacteraceae bacterium]